ncbi:hypothetical protein [Polycladidibacter stylochi]|uniref:hypothetical protein n=1 Tax=Polycladidibacter stylochi TaxID=1807766 RepID=UPI000837153B|nr:hypothetical protein [Pseudovibrio stylochi]
MRAKEQEFGTINCEDALLKLNKHYEELKINNCSINVIDRMLERRFELMDFYNELDNLANSREDVIYRFIESILLAVAHWGPEESAKAREAKKRLKEINADIARKAAELASLLDERLNIDGLSGVSDNTNNCVCQTLEIAAQANENYYYIFHVQEKVRRLYCQYDYKYWPTLSEFIYEVARDAECAKIDNTNEVTAEATFGKRGSDKDFLRALTQRIKLENVPDLPRIPLLKDFSDKAVASLVNCVLDLQPEKLKDAAYIKRYRQGERERKRNLDSI